MDGEKLIKALQNPSLYKHPVKQFSVIETHISWVLLTGDYAYKIKKPVNLGFVDFSTLAKRQYYCEEEIKLNQPLAKELYLSVLPISGDIENPKFTNENPIIEYTIQMKQFSQSALLNHQLQDEKLKESIFEDIAKQIAHFHLTQAPIDAQSPFASPEAILQDALDNFTVLKQKVSDRQVIEDLLFLEQWTKLEHQKRLSLFLKRKALGFIKSCHGDLHLGNIIYENNKLIIFDCLEFNPEFRHIDVMNEIAFLFMDLLVKNHKESAYHFLNAYLSRTGDYEGLPLLNFYVIYRAMIRAKVALLQNKSSQDPEFSNYLDLALSLIKNNQHSILCITHGFSGSGKTKLAKALAPILNAIVIRSDVERKRLFENHIGLPNFDLYSKENSAKTFEHIAKLVKDIISLNRPVIVDATFLRYNHREKFARLASNLHSPFWILDCQAPKEVLKERILARLKQKEDASDATPELLEKQFEIAEALTTEELKRTILLETHKKMDFYRVSKELNLMLSRT